ncbi:MAG: hypothetical protein ABWY55_06360 [Microbacterium sp.]
MTRLTKLLVAAAAALSLVAVPVAAASVSATESAWTDRTLVSATVAAGTWVVAPTTPTTGCVAMGSNGQPISGGTCAITGVSFVQWSDGTNTVRDYTISVTMSPGAVYASITADLSTAAGSGAWSWAKAATIATGQFTPVAGYTCSELPVLRANGPSNWGTSYAFWVKVVQDRTVGIGGTRNCG